MPIFLQTVACSYEGLKICKSRYNRRFAELLQEYIARDSWTYEQKCEYRDKRIQRMVKYCYDFVPYYRRIFNEYGIDYSRIRNLDTLKKLPVITKQDVKDNFDDFISTKIDRKKLIKSHTSGTTGAGFQFYTTNEAINEQWALWWKYRTNLGIERDDWCSVFGGRSIVPVKQKKPPFSRMNFPGKQELFSEYHIDSESIKWYLQELERRKIRWIHGYPSVIHLIAQSINSGEMKLDFKIECITTGAENLLDHQKEAITRAFGVIPYQHYGLSEGVANFSEDKNHEMWVDEDFAAVEFLRNDETGQEEIAGTTLCNYAMPLLRYKTNDIAHCVETSEGRKIISLDGRNEDYLVLKSGRRIGRLDHIFKDMIHVKEAQFVQKRTGEIELLIVKGPQYTQDDEARLGRELNERLGEEQIELKYRSNIRKTNTGKLRFVLSEK